MKVLTNLDLAKNQIKNVVIDALAQAPASPVEGQIYYDTVEKVVKQYDGTTWKTMGSSYILPIASAQSLGGIKVGNNLSIDANGVLSAVDTTYVFNTAYDATTNKAATMADIAALGSVLTFKGAKATLADIEAIVDPEIGDVWHCTADGGEYAYTASNTWEGLGKDIDLSGYLLKSEIAQNITGESTTVPPSQKAVHDAIEGLDLGTVVHKATGSIGIASTSTTITCSGVTTAEIISVKAYVTENGARSEVGIDTSFNTSTNVLTCSATGHSSAVTIEVYYKEA